jgi:hypothetical protein
MNDWTVYTKEQLDEIVANAREEVYNELSGAMSMILNNPYAQNRYDNFASTMEEWRTFDLS